MTSEKPRRRWFQFSLRTLFVAVTLFAIATPFIPKAWAWLFPPQDDPFSGPYDPSYNAETTLILGGGQTVSPQDNDGEPGDKDGGGFW